MYIQKYGFNNLIILLKMNKNMNKNQDLNFHVKLNQIINI